MSETPIADPITTDTRVRHSAEERRQEAVGAVIDLARERGPEGITTQAIAE